jgi:hypothetical protein
MRLYTVYLLLQTAVHVSGSDATHHQEHIQLHSELLPLFTVVGMDRCEEDVIITCGLSLLTEEEKRRKIKILDS